MEHYSITVLKAEKSRLEYELFEKQKFNDSFFADKRSLEVKNVYYTPKTLDGTRNKIKELGEAIDHMAKSTQIDFSKIAKLHQFKEATEYTVDSVTLELIKSNMTEHKTQ